MKGVTKNQIFSQTTFNQPSSTSISRTGLQSSAKTSLDFVTNVYKNNKDIISISPNLQKQVLGYQESEQFENAYTTSVDRVIVDFASANLSESQLNTIFDGTGFENYENKEKLLQTLDSFGFTASDEQMAYTLKHLGIQDNAQNRKALTAVSNQITERLAAAEISNMGGALNQPFQNVVFQPNGSAKVVGGMSYPMGTMYIPMDQLESIFDTPGLLKSPLGLLSYEDAQVGGRKVFAEGEVTSKDGKKYLVIPNAFGKPIDMSDQGNQELLTKNAYSLSDSDLRETQQQRSIDRNAAIGGTLSAPQVVGPMDEVLSALQISEPTRNALSEIIKLAMQEGNRELPIMGGETLAKNFNRIVVELMRDAPDKYPTRRDAERAALVLFESSLLQ